MKFPRRSKLRALYTKNRAAHARLIRAFRELILVFFIPTRRRIWVVRLRSDPGAARRSPWHDSAPRGSGFDPLPRV